MRVRAQTVQSTLTDSYSLCIVYMRLCIWEEAGGKKKENYIMYARVQLREHFHSLRVSVRWRAAAKHPQHPSLH